MIPMSIKPCYHCNGTGRIDTVRCRVCNGSGESQCRAGCPTQDHLSWGDCARAAGIGLAAGETAKGQY